MKFIYTLFLFTSFVGFSQETNFSDEIAIYLDRNHSLDQYGYAYDELLKMLGKQHPKTNQNEKGWKYLETNKAKSLSEIKEQLIPVYKRNFSQSQIKKMIVFYESDTGRQLVADRSVLSEAQKNELNSFYSSELGQAIISKQTILTQEIGIVSEAWSRDLYETAMSLLKN